VCVGGLVCLCVGGLVCWCACVLVCLWAGVLCAGVFVCWCVCVLVGWCARVLVCRGTGWAASQPGRFNFGKEAPDAHSIGGWLGPRGGLGSADKGKTCCISRKLKYNSSVVLLVTILSELSRLPQELRGGNI
jgi:hypothetical protein